MIRLRQNDRDARIQRTKDLARSRRRDTSDDTIAPMHPLTPSLDWGWINGSWLAANVWVRLGSHHDSEAIVAACA